MVDRPLASSVICLHLSVLFPEAVVGSGGRLGDEINVGIPDTGGDKLGCSSLMWLRAYAAKGEVVHQIILSSQYHPSEWGSRQGTTGSQGLHEGLCEAGARSRNCNSCWVPSVVLKRL